MARDFTTNASKITGSNPVSGTPFSMAAWFFPDNSGQGYNRGIIQMGEAGTSNHLWSIYLPSNNKFRYRIRTTSSTQNATSNSYTVDQWNHAYASSAAADDHVAVLNGDWSSRAAWAPSKAPTVNDELMLGNYGPGLNLEFRGHIAEAAMWNAAHLDQYEVEALADGVSPLLIRPSSLVWYVPLVGSVTERISGTALTDQTTSDSNLHPPVFYPAKPYVNNFAAAVGGLSRGSLLSLGVGV